MKSLSVVIIDDEPLARTHLRSLLGELTHWTIIGEAGRGDEALGLIRRLRPDIAFVDIRMPGIDGLDLAHRLQKNPVPGLSIVFVTAYQRYAVEAFEVAAVDYLLKPLSRPRLEQLVARLNGTVDQRLGERLKVLTSALPENADSQGPFLEQIVIRSVGRYQFVNVSDVIAFGSSGNYIEVTTKERQYLHRASLHYMEKHLDPARFIRIHRQSLVALRHIRELRKTQTGSSEVVLSNGVTLAVSKPQAPELLKRLEPTP